MDMVRRLNQIGDVVRVTVLIAYAAAVVIFLLVGVLQKNTVWSLVGILLLLPPVAFVVLIPVLSWPHHLGCRLIHRQYHAKHQRLTSGVAFTGTGEGYQGIPQAFDGKYCTKCKSWVSFYEDRTV